MKYSAIRSFIVLTLFALYIPFSIYAKNNGEIDTRELLVPFLIIISLNILIISIAVLLKINIEKSSLIFSLLWILFFTQNEISTAGHYVGIRFRYSALIVIILSIITIILIFKLKEETTRILLKIFIATSMIMFLPLIFTFFKDLSQELVPLPSHDDSLIVTHTENKLIGDIYFIVLDAYGGDEVLLKYLDCDNSAFYDSLTKLGFKISYNSRSNYTSTLHSISATLNMNYLPEVIDKNIIGSDMVNTKFLSNSIFNSRVLKAFKILGYNTIFFESEYFDIPTKKLLDIPSQNERQLIDEFYFYAKISPYYQTLIFKSALGYFYKLIFPLLIPHSFTKGGRLWMPESITWAFGKGLEYVNNGRRDFVFMHILSPHFPYYYNADGVINYDLINQTKNDHNNRALYINNLLGLNKIVITFLKELITLSNSIKEKPIIIIQGDHGPRVEIKEDEDLAIFTTSILNAFYLPEEFKDHIPNGLSAVNTFRIILSIISGRTYELLPDESFLSNYHKPYKFTRIR